MSRREILDLFIRQEDETRERVSQGIEAYRKGNFRLSLKDQGGKPLCGAALHIKQKTHEFKYGANLFLLDEMETKEKNDAYKKYFAECFNMATLPFYWGDLEPEKGKCRYRADSPKIYRRPAIDLCMDFCEKNGIEPREHAIAYERQFPKWLKGASVEEIKETLETHMADVAARYAARIPTIELTNEMEWEVGQTAFYDAPDNIEWCFKTARKYFPKNELVINEWTPLPWRDRCRTSDKYYSYIEANMLRGAPIDAIGMQFHMFYPAENEYVKTRAFYDPASLYRHMDLYARLGKPLQVTEVTIPAYSNDPEDEEIQAELIRRLYEIWFSHPNMEQILYWNLVDGYAYVADPTPEKIACQQGDMTIGENIYYGGLIRFDMTPKPAYFAIKNLFEKEWHTEAALSTDANGIASFRGFFGDYEVTVNGKTYMVSALKKNANGEIELTVS